MQDNNKLYKRDMVVSFTDKETFIEVGGLKTNVNIKNKTYPELLDAILFPYAPPKIVSSKYSIGIETGKTNILDPLSPIKYIPDPGQPSELYDVFNIGKYIKVTKQSDGSFLLENISNSNTGHYSDNSIGFCSNGKDIKISLSLQLKQKKYKSNSVYCKVIKSNVGTVQQGVAYPATLSSSTEFVSVNPPELQTGGYQSYYINVPYGCSCYIKDINITVNDEELLQTIYKNTEISMDDTLLLEYCTNINIANFYGIINKRSEDIQKYSLGFIANNNINTFSNFSNLTDINNDILSNEISKSISNITISNISPSSSKLTDNSVVTEFSDSLKLYIDVYDSTSNSLAPSNIIFAPAILYGDIAYDESVDNIKNSIIQNVEESNRKPLLHVTNELFEFSQDTENIVFYILAPKTFGNTIIVKDSNNNQYTWSNIGDFTYQYKSSDTTTDMEYSIFISEKIIDTYLSKTINFIVTVRNGIFSDDKYILNGGNALGNFE